MPYGFDEKIVECWIEAEPEKLKLLRHIIKDAAEYVEIDPALVKELVLAVNEASMNIIQHAYQNKPNKEIHLTILHGENGIAFVIQDDAPCVEPSSIVPRELNDIRPGGLGVHFINKIMDEVRYEECIHHGNTLLLAKYL